MNLYTQLSCYLLQGAGNWQVTTPTQWICIRCCHVFCLMALGTDKSKHSCNESVYAADAAWGYWELTIHNNDTITCSTLGNDTPQRSRNKSVHTIAVNLYTLPSCHLPQGSGIWHVRVLTHLINLYVHAAITASLSGCWKLTNHNIQTMNQYTMLSSLLHHGTGEWHVKTPLQPICTQCCCITHIRGLETDKLQHTSNIPQ